MNVIYVIKTMTKCETVDEFWCEFGHERNIGYYCDLNAAQETVINNECDIWETIYTYAMIEEVYEGLYGSAGTRTWWYKYNDKIGMYEEMPQPEFTKNRFGFTIG